MPAWNASALRTRLAEFRHLPRAPRHLWPVLVTRGLISQAEAALLYSLAKEVTEGAIVEIGSYRGRSTTALALGSRAGHGVPVYAVEPHEPFQATVRSPLFGSRDRAAFFRTMLRTGCYREVRLVNLSSEEVAPSWKRPVGMLWIDGDHSVAGVRRDVDSWWPYLLNGAPVVFDDAIDPESGPGVVIADEVSAGRMAPRHSVGKVRVLTVQKNSGF